ncbi:hypothetical protein N658DRAFT_568716 [Parathielavia hyrcaniae]|uniref:SET domain-containing protein n=1 Tax=Parathielavia hyrcaniae TaxID=113614 RepID=A0AAN6PWR9_9PEZI|nr:hypothetical protein N658DRAFT_568716 [Parathielavia hyrcaniae]
MDSCIADGLTGTDLVNKKHSTALFEVKTIDGKGRGLVALFDISPGTQIFCEKPLRTAEIMPPNELERVLPQGSRLSRAEQRQFLSLHNYSAGKHPFGGIFRTNALTCGPGSSEGGVYPTACFINHSYGPSSVRRAFLKQMFAFDCQCRGCSLAPPQRRASDQRRLAIQRFDDAIGDPFRMAGHPRETLGDCASLLQVLMEEHEGYPGALIARLYYDAFQISGVFAQRAYRTRVMYEGEENPETQRVRLFALDPAAHPSYLWVVFDEVEDDDENGAEGFGYGAV